MSTPPTPVPDAEDEELIPPLRHPMFAGDNLFRDPGRRLTRTWYLFFQQLGRRRRGTAAGGAGPFIRTLVLKDLTIGDDIADHVPAWHAGTAVRFTGVLRLEIFDDLTVRVNKNGAAFCTITMPAATAVDTPVSATTFTGDGTVADGDVFSWDILASDEQADIAGVATFTLEWA